MVFSESGGKKKKELAAGYGGTCLSSQLWKVEAEYVASSRPD